jgi:hypothetical protein
MAISASHYELLMEIREKELVEADEDGLVVSVY